jgi:hypothetical protein
MIALYKFRFYELDQTIQVGAEGEFLFFADPHYLATPCSPILPDTILVFANTLPGPPVVAHRCRINAIRHLTLGSVRAISTDGLEYSLILEDGATIAVDAEEHPGRTSTPFGTIADWVFLVDVEPIGTSSC